MERQTSRSPKAHLESSQVNEPYTPHDVIGESMSAAGVSFLAGAFTGGVRNAMSRGNLGASGFLVRQAPIIGLISTHCPFLRGGFPASIWGLL